MGYEKMWSLLNDLLTELRKKGEAIPANVMKDLHSAKTMIQILQADPTHTENVLRVETYLKNVEFHLISVAQDKLGPEHAEQWMRKLGEARKKVSEGEAAARFVPGIPRGKHWVRVQISEETPQKDIERLAKENRLSHKIQEDGYVLVYGKNEHVKSFVKKLAEKFRRAKKS